MVILFLIALVLAWPTAGISIIAYVAFAVLRNYLAARVRSHDANIHAARKSLIAGEKRVPSWAGDKDENDIFVKVIQQKAMHDGVPQAYLQNLLRDGDTFQNLVYFAGAMEHHGSSFTEQQAAVSDELVELWKVAPDDTLAGGLQEGRTAAKAQGATTEQETLQPSVAQGDNAAQRLINSVKQKTDMIADRYPPSHDGHPDTNEIIINDAMKALAEMKELFKEADEAKTLCNQISELEPVSTRPMIELFISQVEDNFQAVILNSVQVQTKIIDAINRMVLLNSNVPDGEGKEAMKDLVANLTVSAKKMGELHAEMADGMENVVVPAMRRAKDLDRKSRT
ncbi:hypothetical protein [Phaeobacter sp. JH20_07]|uniref:hypothetical protein n=1 Tax=Phaeobacter sp. JH20_07 TaxID=3112466 RepID=UPI003A890436